MSWTIKNASMSDNNSKITFMVVDYKTRTKEDRPLVLHNYKKVIKVIGS